MVLLKLLLINSFNLRMFTNLTTLNPPLLEKERGNCYLREASPLFDSSLVFALSKGGNRLLNDLNPVPLDKLASLGYSLALDVLRGGREFGDTY